MAVYSEDLAVASRVRIKSAAVLQTFARPMWKYHHPAGTEMMRHADSTARVARVSYYHGGGVLCELDGVPGIWHEGCLEADAGS
jgi:hypothetical protein